MKSEDVIRMAREAGFDVNFDIRTVSVEGVHINKELERFAALIAASEREECAKTVERAYLQLDGRQGLNNETMPIAGHIVDFLALAVRSRTDRLP